MKEKDMKKIIKLNESLEKTKELILELKNNDGYKLEHIKLFFDKNGWGKEMYIRDSIVLGEVSKLLLDVLIKEKEQLQIQIKAI
jgi:hypothetical protein